MLIIISCGKPEDKLELTLLNNKIFCINNMSPSNDEEILKLLNKNDTTYNNLSKNILTYRLTNKSDKKYFIVLNDNNLTTLECDSLMKTKIKDKINYYNQIAFNLYSNSTIINGEQNLFVASSNGDFGCELFQNLEFVKDAKKLYDNRITIFYKEVLENSFVLHPHETKYFTSIVNLPFRLDGSSWHSLINGKTNYASLTLVNHKKKTESMLSKNQKKEIKENGYVIFDGIIESNKVPVKMISMPN